MAPRRLIPLVSAAAALALASGCSGNGSAGSAGGAGPGGLPAVSHQGRATLEKLGPDRSLAALQRGRSQLPSAIIKTASLSLTVKHGVERAAGDAGEIAQALGGFVQSSSVDRSGRRHALVVLRVPADQVDSALDRLARLGRVRSRHEEGRDVSRQIVDLAARLRNTAAQERALLRLMRRARTVAATLRVEDVLARVQLEREEIQGELRYVRARAALGTITLDLSASGAPAPSPPGQISQAFSRTGHALLAVVAGAIVVLGVGLPLAAVAGLATAAVILVRRRLQPPAPGDTASD